MPIKELSSSELAAALGISAGRVRQLALAGVLPRTASGKYSLSPCRKAFTEYKRRAAAAGDESTYLQYLKTSNDLLEKQNQVKRGELIHRDDFILAISARLQATRARLLVLPSKAAPLLVGNNDRDSLSVLKRLVDEARRELAGAIDFCAIAKAVLKDKKRR